jgi:MFS family permease
VLAPAGSPGRAGRGGSSGGAAEALEEALLPPPAAAGAAAPAPAPAPPGPPADGAPALRLGLGHQRLRVCGGCTLTVAHVPYLLFASDFIIAVGAGMTIAYFPLFFSQQEGLSPVALSLLFAAVPALIAAVGLLLVPLSQRCGRAPAALLANALGTLCLFALWLALRLPTPVVCAFYLVRGGAMNGSAAIQRGLLMDVVPKRLRGRWSALEALTSFTWTGSALFGGWLVAGGSYTASFLYTAIIYAVALFVFLPILPLTRGERVDGGGDGEGGKGEEGAAAAEEGA